MVSFLGRLTDERSRALYFLGRDGAVIQSTSTDNGFVIQAFKRLVLSEANLKKGIPLDPLQTILSTYDAALEISSSTPDEEWVRRLEPFKGKKRGIIEESLRRLEKDLRKEEDDYLQWKGVRDLEEAHYNLKKRQDEISDLNQKLYHNSLEPQFIYNPGHPLRKGVSAWQTNDRVHFRELKDQAKERASAVRLRIDFTRRQRIKDLKDKRKELLEELEEERKREKDYEKGVASIVDSSSAVFLSIVVRSKFALMAGRKDAVVRACESDVLDAAARLRRTLKESMDLVFQDSPAVTSLLGIPEGLTKVMAPSEEFHREISKVVSSVIGRVPARAKLPDIRFPRFGPNRRFAYLGLALRDNLSRTTFPILYDLDEQGPRHTAVVGGSGSGKSVAASLIVEGAATNGIPVVVFDPTGSWAGFAEPCTSKSLLEAFPEFGLQSNQARAFNLRVVVPKEEGYEQEILTEALSGSGISVFTSDSMTSAQEASFAAALLQDLLERMRAWPESKTLKLLLVFEEAHRYLGEKALEPILEVFARTARARGVGLLIVSQVAVDLPPSIRNNVATKLQLQSNYAGDLARAAQVFGSEYRKLIPKFPKGVGAMLYPEFGTALVAFRPPLHSTAGLSSSSYQFFQSLRDLSNAAAELTRHAATSDTTTTPSAASGEIVQTQPRESETPGGVSSAATSVATTWRDVATRFKNSGLRASDISRAIQEAGLSAPSLRTIQRFR